MMSSLTNLKAIASVQNIEQRQISESTGTSVSNSSRVENDTDLTNISKDKFSKNNIGDDFKKLLIKVENNKKEPISNSKVENKSNNTNKVKIDSKEIEEKIEDLDDKQLVECLNLLVEFFNSVLKDESQIIDKTELNGLSEEFKISLMEVLNSNEVVNPMAVLQGTSNILENSQEVLKNLLTLLNKTDVVEKIDVNTLKIAEKLLNNETVNKLGDNTALTEVVNETVNKINELLNSNVKKNDELSLQNNSLNNVYKVIESSNSNETSNNSDSESYSSSDAKDEKLLQSILKDSSQETKVPVFTTTTTFVNNATGAVVETKQTVNVETMATDVVTNVKYMEANDMREMIVKVNPGNLGEITIKLIEENGDMKLHMKAVSKETYSLLVQQSSDIKSQLSDQNIKIHDVNISLYEDDTTFFKDGEFSRSFQEQNGNKGNGKTDKADLNIIDDEDSDDEYYDSSALDLLV